MLINGVARQACSTLIDPLEQPITLAPLTKFPLVRDLKVDRQKLFEHLKRVHAWIDIDGVFDLGPGPRMSQETRDWAYELSKCMTCGCCFEACPNTKLADTPHNFMGARTAFASASVQCASYGSYACRCSSECHHG